MFKRLILTVFLLFASMNAGAGYTDVYYNPDESGWGVFVMQSDAFQFLAFYIYGPDNRPTWYTAQITQDATGNFNGLLYATTGTYFALPWNPAQLTNASVGTVSFRPMDNYHATIVFTLTGSPPVQKVVQRQTLTANALAGSYSGSMSGTVSGCADPTSNAAHFRARYGLVVTQNGEASATLTFTFVDDAHAGLVCTLTGPLTHFGQRYRIGNAQANCVGPGVTPGPFADAVDSLHTTERGIEGHWSGPQAEGCVLSLNFAAVENN